MHEKGLLGRGGRGTLQLSGAPDGNWAYIYIYIYIGVFFGFGITSEPTSTQAARPRPRRGRPPLAFSAAWPCAHSLTGAEPSSGREVPFRRTHTHTHTRGPPGPGTRGTRTLVGGWV